MNTKLILLIAFFAPIFTSAQTKNYDELYGFRLGQYAAVIYNELGEPNQTQMGSDSTENLIYFVTPDSSTYIIAGTSSTKPKQIISLQVTGKFSSRTFYGLKLGSTFQTTEKILGKPDTILSQNFNKNESVIWKYIHSRISLLFQQEKLKSIKIWEGNSDTTTIPPLPFEDLLLAFGTQDKKSILDMMSPEMEVYFCGQVIGWNHSIYYDSSVDTSSVYNFLTNEEYGISSLSMREFTPPELNLRVTQNYGLLLVYKFADDPVFEEIVLKQNRSRYQIWEVKYICPEEGESNE